ncbi:MAG: hypothetical protein HQL92_02815 [Magnetococcales bacterium]|nr:hypothetical protein [Magnetococcales bacterium]
MDFTEARVNMVKSQAVPNMVQNQALLEGLLRIPREDYTTSAHREFAYSDHPVLWDDGGRRSLTPVQTGWMIQELDLTAGDRVLVVGAGSGYECAVLSAMGMEVFAVESDADLAARGARLTDPARVQWRVAPMADGWTDAGRFDAILICGAVAELPNKLIGQLQPDGVLVGIVGQSGDVTMRAVRVSGIPVRQVTLYETVAPVLPGFGESGGFRL